MKQSGNKRWHSTETSQISTSDFILRAIDQKKSRISWHNKPCHSLKKTGEHRSISFCTPMVRKLSFSEILSSPYQLCFIWYITSGQWCTARKLSWSITIQYLCKWPTNCLSNCSTACYEDDTKLLLSLTVNDSACVIESVNSDLQRIRNWCFDNWVVYYVAN